MVLFPKGGLGRVLLATIIISTVAYLTLNIVSFAGARWITYVDVPVRFGLWKVCDTTRSGLCNQWSDDQYATVYTNGTFNGDKPSFIRTAQALEIISLIFYIVAAVLIVIGIVDIPGFAFEIAFGGAIGLLFVAIVFISATLGHMSKKGRRNHPGAFHDWAWWNGLVGLIMTIVCFFALIFLILYMRFSKTSAAARASSKTPKGAILNGVWGHPDVHSMGMGGHPAPVMVPHYPAHQQYHQPGYEHYPQQHHYTDYSHYPQQHHYTDHNHYPQQHHSDHQWQQNHPNQYQNSMVAYGDHSAAEQYFHHQTPSPMISELARQYVSQGSHGHHQNQYLDPYTQYLHDPYLMHNYI